MISMRTIGLAAAVLLLSVNSVTAEAMSHLDRDELKLLSATSVAVVYLDTGKGLQPFIAQPGAPNLGVGLVGGAVAGHQANKYLSLVTPYQGAIDKLDLPQATHKGLQDALASVSAMQETPWATVKPDPDDKFFMKGQALKTGAQIVIFIQPQLLMNWDGDRLYMISTIDIVTLDANGKTYDHYDSSILRTQVDVDDDQLPPLATPPSPEMDDEDVRAERLFANDGKGFMQVYSKLLQQAQQQFYYFFTGTDTPPPAAVTGDPGPAHSRRSM
ncbi:MAG TPA: hypothetical protein VGH91_11025 [Gammaproteobacteria bacterium]